MLDPQLQPISPNPESRESMEIFEEHKALASKYFRVQEQMTWLSKNLGDLNEELSRSAESEEQIIRRLESEKEALVQLKQNLEEQVAQAKLHGSREDGEWVICSQTHLPE